MPVFAEIAPFFNEGGRFIAFDLETTGLDPKRDCIVEIGAVKFGKSGVISRFSVLVNPGIPMPFGAGAVNNITDDMLKDKPSLDAVFPDFLRFIKDAVIVAHNAPFDCGFINEALTIRYKNAAEAAEEGLDLFSDEESQPVQEAAALWTPPFPMLPNRIVDTIVFAKEALPDMRKYNLQDLADSLSINVKDAHRAEDDARVCMEIFLRCVHDEMKRIPEEAAP
ncbi:MAG: 3'-5' exonuclease [Treponema sp.]|jgi:DNA polymerase-3 subunit epsilon|nr:3'-5' exonuclease [Treponema sp.]